MKGDLFERPALAAGEERFDTLLERRGVRLERIVSVAARSPEGFWYDQDRDEWVALLQGEAELLLGDGRRVTLRAGETFLLPAHLLHRVERTSANPPAIWLALFLEPER